MTKKFNPQALLTGKNITIRSLQVNDFEDIYSCASDKEIWVDHPDSGRYKKEVFAKWFEGAIKAQSVVVTDNDSGKVIGSSRYYPIDSAPDDISIGFTFLACQYWGGKTNLELKKLMLDHAFCFFDTVWFHIAPSNIRSQKAILKIGAIYSHDEISKISSIKETWLCYRINKDEWL